MDDEGLGAVESHAARMEGVLLATLPNPIFIKAVRDGWVPKSVAGVFMLMADRAEKREQRKVTAAIADLKAVADQLRTRAGAIRIAIEKGTRINLENWVCGPLETWAATIEAAATRRSGAVTMNEPNEIQGVYPLPEGERIITTAPMSLQRAEDILMDQALGWTEAELKERMVDRLEGARFRFVSVGSFTADQLEALAVWMRAHTGEKLTQDGSRSTEKGVE